MAFISPLNDKVCLAFAIAEAKRLARRPEFRRFVAQFRTSKELIRYIRSLEQRDDLGDPDDGPRIPCEVSQRLRYNPKDPNCFERAVIFLAAAEILDPKLERTLASLVLDRGWHTFPVELIDGRPYVVNLDPVGPPNNTMLATAYKASKISPVASQNLVPWFGQVARNACRDDGYEEGYDYAIDSLRNAMMTGAPLADSEDIEYMLDRAFEDAEMFGGQGYAAAREMERSIRNLEGVIRNGWSSGFLGNLTKAIEDIAPKAIKTALISYYGPAAGLAFDGVEMAIKGQPKEEQTQDPRPKPEPPQTGKDVSSIVGTVPPGLLPSFDQAPASTEHKAATDEASKDKRSKKELMRRMTFGFRAQPQKRKD